MLECFFQFMQHCKRFILYCKRMNPLKCRQPLWVVIYTIASAQNQFHVSRRQTSMEKISPLFEKKDPRSYMKTLKKYWRSIQRPFAILVGKQRMKATSSFMISINALTLSSSYLGTVMTRTDNYKAVKYLTVFEQIALIGMTQQK